MLLSLWTLLKDLFIVYVLLWLRLAILIKKIFSPVFRFFFAPLLPELVKTPQAEFRRLPEWEYPFSKKFLEFPTGGNKSPNVHYVDEGNAEGPVILLLHGESSWSFMYRRVISAFAKKNVFRVIAPDFIGFGNSDKYTNSDDYNHRLHTETIRQLIDQLHLNDIIMVAHGMGAMVGLTVVAEMKEKFTGIVIMNSWLPDGTVFNVSSLYSLNYLSQLRSYFPYFLWRSFVELFDPYLPMSYFFFFVHVFPLKIWLNPEQLLAYEAPFPGLQYKAGVIKWPLMVPLFNDDSLASVMQNVKNFLGEFWKKPTLLLFSDDDWYSQGQKDIFKGLIPHAKVKVIEGAEHFITETEPVNVTESILNFARNILDEQLREQNRNTGEEPIRDMQADQVPVMNMQNGGTHHGCNREINASNCNGFAKSTNHQKEPRASGSKILTNASQRAKEMASRKLKHKPSKRKSSSLNKSAPSALLQIPEESEEDDANGLDEVFNFRPENYSLNIPNDVSSDESDPESNLMPNVNPMT